MRRLIYAGLIGLLLSTAVAFAQQPVKIPEAQQPATVTANPEAKKPEAPPVLTDVQKLQIQNLLQRLEIAQLKAQQAGADFEKARGEIGQLVQALQVPGYELNMQTLEYSKKPEPPKAPAKDPPTAKK